MKPGVALSRDGDVETRFFISQVYPSAPLTPQTVLGPLRFSLLNGSTYPNFLRAEPPPRLLKHWKKTFPRRSIPFSRSVVSIPPKSLVFPVVGRDSVERYGEAPPVETVTRDEGIENFLRYRKNHTVLTPFVGAVRTITCHFFLHPSFDVVWFGCTETRGSDDECCGPNNNSRTVIVLDEQKALALPLIPIAKDLAQHFLSCASRDFWGFFGMEIAIDMDGKVAINCLRHGIHGACPALMAGLILRAHCGDYFSVGIFSDDASVAYPGSARDLLKQVEKCNKKTRPERIVILSLMECGPKETLVNAAVYGSSIQSCELVLSRIVRPLTTIAS